MRSMLHWYAANPNFTMMVVEFLGGCILAAGLYHFNYRRHRANTF